MKSQPPARQEPSLQDWLEKGVRSAPAAGPVFRGLAGLLFALFALVGGHWLFRLGRGDFGLADFNLSVIPLALALAAMFTLFGVVAVTGSTPVRLWKTWLRLCGRL